MILEQILASKLAEVAVARARLPLADVRSAAASAPAPRDFATALASSRQPPAVIAEVKRASPSRGLIRPDFDPLRIARSYAAAGADAISVLTDAPFFQGSLDHLRQVRQGVDLPLLRKDFIIDGYQIHEARAAGADAILLIVAAFLGPEATAAGRSPALLAELQGLAAELGMAALVEVHTAAELAAATAVGATLIGVNNRDLRTFQTDLAVTFQLGPLLQPQQFLVSESGLRTTGDLRQVAAAGAGAVLVGESLMRAADPGQALRRLRGEVE